MSGVEAVAEFRQRTATAIDEHRHHDHRRAILIDFLEKGYGISLDEVDLEHNIKTDEARGRIDLLYRHLIFEVKRDLDAEDDDVQRELRKYLEYTGGDRSMALATDGTRFDAYRLSGNEVQKFASLDVESVDDAELFDWLDGFLFSQAEVEPSARDVVRRFGPVSAVYSAGRDELSRLWAQVEEEPSVKVKASEWEDLLRIVYGSSQGSTDLFLRHTYLALVARLLAFLALTRSCPAPGAELGIMSGDAFERAGIANFVEEDFFGWLDHPMIREDARKLIGGLCRHLDIYATAEIDEDLLKHLYETLVDPAERHDLGEYYTPDWLAEYTLREAGLDRETTLLDPACGSGTFLFSAIRLLREQGIAGADLVRVAERNLAGFDVHPLAVTVARANFLLALGSDAQGEAVDVPIWMANSLSEPSGAFGKPIEVVVTAEEVFRLPTEMEDVLQGLLHKAIDVAVLYASPKTSDAVAHEGMEAWLKAHHAGEFYDEYWKPNLTLLRKLVDDDRNTVWRFVLTNAVRPQMAARRPVDLVAGNPPWLPVRSISERPYQEHVTKLAVRYGILAERRGWETGALEIATVFACFSADWYLKPGGRLALVLPRGVLFGAKQHDRFRRMVTIPALKPILGVDLQHVDPLFNVPSCVVIAEKPPV